MISMAAQKTVKQLLDTITATCNKEEITFEDYYLIKRSFYDLGGIFKLKHLHKENMEVIWEIELQMATVKKSYRRKIEKDLLEFMGLVALTFDGLKENGTEEKEDKLFKAALLLDDFVQKIFNIKIPRDTFSGERKGYASKILVDIAHYFEEAEVIDFIKEALKGKSKSQFVAVTDAFQEYYKNSEMLPDEEVIDIINKRYKKAKTYVEAMASLQFLVETQVIGEMEAMSRIDDWKEKNKDEYW